MVEDFKSPAEVWRASWQGRILAVAPGALGRAVTSILADSFPDDIEAILRATFAGFVGLRTPFFCTSGRVVKTGHVCADMVDKAGRLIPKFPIWRNKEMMTAELRWLADIAKLTDLERVEMFTCVGRWLVCDERLDPTLDRNDPDAPRLTEPGMKLAKPGDVLH